MQTNTSTQDAGVHPCLCTGPQERRRERAGGSPGHVGEKAGEASPR